MRDLIEQATNLTVIDLCECWEDIEAASTIGDDRTIFVATFSERREPGGPLINMRFRMRSGNLILAS